MATSLPAFLAVSLIVIVTPGQDTALTIRNTLFGGRRSGLFTALGVSIGQGVWAAATSLGVAAVLTASKPAFTTLRVVGAVYLVFLGVQTLRAAFGGRAAAGTGRPQRRIGARTALRQGVVSNLGNPKMAIFFPSLLPQFAARPSVASLLVLGAILCALTLVWLSAYAVAVARARAVLERPRIRRTIDGVTGGALIGLGLRLATERG